LNEADKKINVVGWFGDEVSKQYICELWGGEVRKLQRKSIPKSELVSLIKNNPNKVNAFLNKQGVVSHDDDNPVKKIDIGDFLIGDALKKRCKIALSYERRDAYYEMEKFCTDHTLHGKVGIVYGMRNTGKTIILQQLAGREDYVNNSAYLTLRYKQCDIQNVYEWIDNLRLIGVKYIFIDEVTWAEGFIEFSAPLADDWGTEEGVKIILSGTDSLAFTWAGNNSLYHRFVRTRTTWMGFPESQRVRGGDIIDYIRNGGVFWEDNVPAENRLETYLRTSVVENIYNTIRNIDKSTVDAELLMGFTKEDLYVLCYAICESLTIDYVMSKAHEVWGQKFAFGLKKALNDCRIRLTKETHEKIVNESGEFQTGNVVFSKNQITLVIDILRQIGFLTIVPFYLGEGYDDTAALIFSQPGVACEFIKNVVRSVRSNLDSLEAETIIVKLNENTDGYLLESVALLTCLRTVKYLDRKDETRISVGKFRQLGGGHEEIDIVRYHYADRHLQLMEVKRSETSKSSFCRHLVNDAIVDYFKGRFGAETVERILLYRGENKVLTTKGVAVQCLNIGEFLSSSEFELNTEDGSFS
jgi:hypothetical protein